MLKGPSSLQDVQRSLFESLLECVSACGSSGCLVRGCTFKTCLTSYRFFNNAFSGRKGDPGFFPLCSKHLKHFSDDLLVFFSNSRLIKRGIKRIFKGK